MLDDLNKKELIQLIEKLEKENKELKCNECSFRELTPLTEDIILKHLKGEITIGIYPLLPGDLCNFLAIDFDKKTFEKDVVAFWNICDELDIPIYVEKSRSGNGAHVWIFFEESIPARIAKKMGNILLTKTMEKASLDLDSYDRLFPNQDTMPKGGFGKTVVGAKIISELKTNTLVIVNRNNLLEQWKERLSYFLNINKKDIGQIGSGKENLNGKLDVASFQSLSKKDNLEELVKDYGLVIVDECHHVAAYSFEKVLKAVRGKHVYGLTATPTRKDGWHKIIYMQCGDIRVRMSHRELKQNKEMEHTVIVKKTNYKYIPSEEKDKIQISEILR